MGGIELRSKIRRARSLAEGRLGEIDMITAYKYSQSINTKEGKEFLAVNKEVLLGVNEERKKCGLYIRVNFLRHHLVGSVSPLAWQDFEGLNKALVQQGITRSWQESARYSEWPFSPSASRCRGAVPAPTGDSCSPA